MPPANSGAEVMPFNLNHPFHSPHAEGPRRDLVWALALKGILLIGIYLLFFGPAHRSPSDAAATAAALIGTVDRQGFADEVI